MLEQSVKKLGKSKSSSKKAHSLVLTKGHRTHEKILQSAIYCLAHLGYEKTTFQSIADHCGISQPLVVHYFKKKENVFPDVIEYLTSRTRKIIDTELDHAHTPTERLREFIAVSIEYARREPESAKIFLTLSFLAAFDERYRQSNAAVKQVAINELIEILAAGVKTGEFEVDEITTTAKLLTSYIMGVRMNLLNERALIPDHVLVSTMQNHCVSIVQSERKKVTSGRSHAV